MSRFQRTGLFFLISLVFPVYLWAAPAEMVTVSTTAIGPTATLCQQGTAASPVQGAAFIAILDNAVWFTIHSATATPSSTLGAQMGPGQSIVVDHATDFRAVRSGAADARLYVVCVP